MQPTKLPPTRVNWFAVALFYGLACAISWPLFWLRDLRPEQWDALHIPGSIKGLVPALGPALAAVLVLVAFRHRHLRTVTLFGTSLSRSLLFAALPVAGFALLGLDTDRPHRAGLIFGGLSVVYGVLEELGWRGFLQDALRPLAEPLRYALIGILWGTWHFTTFYHGTPTEIVIRLAWLYPLWMLGSWGIGRATDRTHSLIVAVMLHLIFNFLSLVPVSTAGPVLAVSIVGWILMLRTWPRSSVVPLAPDRPGS